MSYYNPKKNYQGITTDPSQEPQGPIWQDPGPNPYPNEPATDKPDTIPTSGMLNINPLLHLLGIDLNLPNIEVGIPNNIPPMTMSQQRKIQKQYPALSSIFGTNLQPKYISSLADDGGGDDPEPGDPEPTPNPYPIEIHYPDPGNPDPEPSPSPDPYPYPDPEPNGGYPGTGNDNTNQQIANLQAAMQQVLAQTLRMASQSAQNANYYQANNNTSSTDYKDSIQQVNNSLNALKEANQIQQNNLDKFLSKVADEKNQENYSNMLRQYAQMRDQVQASQELAARMAYAAQNQDYQNVANEVQNYTVPDQPATQTYTPINSDWQTKPDFNNQPKIQTLGGDSNAPAQYYYPPQNQNYAPAQSYPAYNQNPGYNYGTSSFPEFHLGVSNSNSSTPIETNSVPSGANPEATTELGDVMSASATVTDFMDRLNTIPEIDSNVIKQALATYQGPTGQKIQADFQKTLQAGIEKIAQECVDGAKAFKLATEISEKAAPILTAAYIVEQFIQGFQKGGISDSAIRGGIAIAESFIATMIFGALIATELTVLPAATITLLASLIIDYVFEQLLNYLKL